MSVSRLEREVTGRFALYSHHLKTVLNTQWGLTEQPAWTLPLFSCLQERDIQDSKSQTLTWEAAKKSLRFPPLAFSQGGTRGPWNKHQAWSNTEFLWPSLSNPSDKRQRREIVFIEESIFYYRLIAIYLHPGRDKEFRSTFFIFTFLLPFPLLIEKEGEREQKEKKRRGEREGRKTGREEGKY